MKNFLPKHPAVQKKLLKKADQQLFCPVRDINPCFSGLKKLPEK
jgi:hypothetical protein